jgi:DNA-binding NarL/FixJ family response regulator
MLNATSEAAVRDIRIVLVDDHDLFSAGLCLLIQQEPGMVLVGRARNRSEAFERALLRPDIILLDLGLDNECSLDFLPDLMEAAGNAHVVVLTAAVDTDLHLRAVTLGTRGVLLKSQPPDSLFKAIRKVHGGELWLTRSLVSSVMSRVFGSGSKPTEDPEILKIANLTAREREVITLIAEGRKNKAIADRLCISERTVGHYLSSIFSKLEVTDRLELLIYACQHGIARIPVPAHGPALPNARVAGYSRAS